MLKRVRGIRLLLLDPRFFQDITPTIRTFRRLFENVIRHTPSSPVDAIEHPIERNLCAHGIAVLAGFDHLFGLA